MRLDEDGQPPSGPSRAYEDAVFLEGRRYQQELVVKWLEQHKVGHMRGLGFVSHVHDLDRILSDGLPSYRRPECFFPDAVRRHGTQHYLLIVSDEDWQAFKGIKIE